MVPLDDLPSFALFARVVELRSFSAAAREAELARSAVSKRIARLEGRLGVRLLHRSTRTLSLTHEGTRFYEHCAAMIAAATAAEAAVAGASALPSGTLRVNAPVTFAHMHLAQAIALFLQTHPGVEVELVTDNRLVDAVEGGFDVVVRITRLRDSSLYARKIATDRLVICASPGYLERAGTPASPADLVAHNCMHYALVRAADEWRFRAAYGAGDLPVRGNFTTTDGTVLRAAALAGLGLAVLPSFMVARDVADGLLRLVLEGARRARIGIYALYPHRERLPARTTAFLEFLVGHFARLRLGPAPEGDLAGLTD
jgi:DNA-binding transcriptional LysR family regulator